MTSTNFSRRLQYLKPRSIDLDKLTSSHKRVRSESNPENKILQGKLTTGPQTMIVGDFAVKNVRHLFWADGTSLNKSGVKLFISNFLLKILCHSSAPPAKDERQEESKHQEDTIQHVSNHVPPQGPPEETLKQEGHQDPERESPPCMLTAISTAISAGRLNAMEEKSSFDSS